MLLKLFLIFLKINLLSTSGPASIGLTQKLIVPDLVNQEKFSEMVAITSGIPGSDAMQMAWQTGFAVKGFLGAFVAILGALIPCLFLVSLIMFSLKLIQPKLLNKFFVGVNPALAVMLTFTAISLLPVKQINPISLTILGVSIIMFLLKVPVTICLITAGLIGILFLK